MTGALSSEQSRNARGHCQRSICSENQGLCTLASRLVPPEGANPALDGKHNWCCAVMTPHGRISKNTTRKTLPVLTC